MPNVSISGIHTHASMIETTHANTSYRQIMQFRYRLCSVLIFFAIKGTPYIPDKWIAIGIGVGIALFALAKITNGIPFSIGIGFSSKTGYIQKSAWFDRLCYITSLIVLAITIGRIISLYAL